MSGSQSSKWHVLNSRKRSSGDGTNRRLSDEFDTLNVRFNYLTRYVVQLRDRISSLERSVETNRVPSKIPSQLTPSSDSSSKLVSQEVQTSISFPVVHCTPENNRGRSSRRQQKAPEVHYAPTQSTESDECSDSLIEATSPKSHHQRLLSKPHPCSPSQSHSSRKKRRRSFIIPLELRRSSANSRRSSNSGVKHDGLIGTGSHGRQI